MAKVLWAIVCESTVVDQRSNNISLFNVLEQLQLERVSTDGDSAEDLPRSDKDSDWLVLPYQLHLASLFVRDGGVPEEVTGRTRIMGPNEKIFGEPIEFKADLVDHPRARNITQFNQIPFCVRIPAQGEHRFRANVNTDSG